MEPLISSLQDFFEERIGIKPHMLTPLIWEKIINKRMNFLKISDCQEYMDKVRDSHKEQKELIEQIVVPETWFFRDREVIDWIAQNIYSKCIKNGDKLYVRILSIACSTGEEPYSILMALADAGVPLKHVKINGIDIGSQSIAKAEAGIYTDSSFRGKNLDYRNRYFEDLGSGSYKISRSLRESAELYQGNVCDPQFFLPYQAFDFILCRNLFIYLNTDAQKKVIELITKSLKPEGYLFVAPCETELLKYNGFVQVSAEKTSALQKTRNKAYVITEKKNKTSRKKAESHDVAQHSKPLPGKIDPAAQGWSEIERARYLANIGYFEQSTSTCLDYITKHGVNSEIYFLLGLMQHAKGNEEIAEDYFQKALYLDPFHHEALIYLSLLAQKRGDDKQAELLLNRAEKATSRRVAK